MAVAAKKVVIEVKGMPGGIELKKSPHYGMAQLSTIWGRPWHQVYN